MAAPSFSATIVTYRTPGSTIAAALRSLAAAIEVARQAQALGEAQVHVVDNSPREAAREAAQAVRGWDGRVGALTLHTGHGNLGYGRANNLVLPLLRSDVHLVMNPDVEAAADALLAGLRTLEQHPEVGLVAPEVRSTAGEKQHLCKRYPSVRVLFLRGFAPAGVRQRHRSSIEHYEMRDALADRFVTGVPLASGCFMLLRTAVFARLGGFDPRYFMYFEDYDLSMRLARETQIAYQPAARIVHSGGDAARKGLRHVAWFATSAWRFFSRHGWKL